MIIPLNFAVAVLLDVPVGIAIITFLPMITAMVTFVFEIVGLHDFGRQYGLRIRFVHYVKLVVGGPFYQVMLAGAAIRAVWREQRGRNEWELTSHTGAHLTSATATATAVPATAATAAPGVVSASTAIREDSRQ